MTGSILVEKLLSRRMSRILIVILGLLVLVLSLTPRPESVLGALSAYDKLGHFIAYIALAFYAMCAVDRRGPLPIAVTIAGCTLFGGIIEIVQPLVGRQRELGDFLVDLTGAVIGAAIAALLIRKATPHEGDQTPSSTSDTGSRSVTRRR